MEIVAQYSSRENSKMKFIKSVIILQFMCLHWKNTKGMINKDAISLMKKGVVILNFARDVLVNQEDIVDALVSEKVRCYVTDFPTKEIVGVRGAIVIPHLGASTEESEDNCAKNGCGRGERFSREWKYHTFCKLPGLRYGSERRRRRELQIPS